MGKKEKNQVAIVKRVFKKVEDQEEEIRAKAYQFFCDSGYQDGHDQEHWLAAERHVLEESHKR